MIRLEINSAIFERTHSEIQRVLHLFREKEMLVKDPKEWPDKLL